MARDGTARVARHRVTREHPPTAVSGAEPAGIRQRPGLTPAQLAEAAGLTRARISRIGHGDAVGLETLRAHVTALGGRLDIVARIGDIQFHVA